LCSDRASLRLPRSTSLPSPFFSTDPATTEIYTLSLHDALPISATAGRPAPRRGAHTVQGRNSTGSCSSSSRCVGARNCLDCGALDRKSTRLNSSHVKISYAVFCLKKKRQTQRDHLPEGKTRRMF